MNATESSSKRTKVANAATVEEVEALCNSPELSLEALRDMIGSLPPGLSIPNPSFLHRACENKNVTLGIVEYLLDLYPDAANAIALFRARSWGSYRTSAYPLHIACTNADCPPAIVALLLRENPLALRQLCEVDGGVGSESGVAETPTGLPLHYFLSRRSGKRDFDTVRMLAEEYPESLMVQDTFAPIHCLVDNPRTDVPMIEIIQYFFEVNPECFGLADGLGRLPLHIALQNKNITPEAVHALLDCFPGAVNHIGGDELPIHTLCSKYSDEESSLELLRRFLAHSPRTARARDEFEGLLPIHFAASYKSPAFCKTLIDAFPESVRTPAEGADMLPIHYACSNSIDAAKYLYDLYPEAIHVGQRGQTPLEIARKTVVGTSKKIDQDGRIGAFLEVQLKYTNLAGDADALATQDGNGWLPLHHALRGGASLGTIKLLAQGFPVALEAPGIMQVAYEFSSLDVVQLLVHLTGNRLDHFDANLNTPLHLACREQNLEVAKYLFEEFPAAVSKPNASGKLPFHLLCESISKLDSGCPGYTEFVWLLLLAHPGAVKFGTGVAQ